jgi:hypothetical protein
MVDVVPRHSWNFDALLASGSFLGHAAGPCLWELQATEDEVWSDVEDNKGAS